MALNISIAPEPIFSIGQFVVTNSFFTTLIVATILVLFALGVGSRPLTLLPKGRSLQNLLEMVFESLMSLYTSILGPHKSRVFFGFITTFFIFILISNWSGLIPGVGSIGVWGIHNGEEVLIPLFRAPTADLNTTIALALIAMVFVQIQGFKALKFAYLKKFFNFSNPINIFIGLIELISEFVKVISFAFRLFGNIFAGEVLLLVMGSIIAIPVIGSLPTLPFLGLEIFVGFIQSVVFIMLILVFTAGAAHKH